MTEKNISHGDVSLYYTVSGTGDPVVLVHGFGEDSSVWDGLREALQDHFTVIVPDLPGSGRSAGTSDKTSIESLADNVRLVLDNERIGGCAMIGHSMGGYITLAFAASYPEKISKLGLFHSTSFPDSEEKKLARKKNIDFITRNGALKFQEQIIPGLFSRETNEKNPALVQRTIQRYGNFSGQSLVHYTAAMMNRPGRMEVLKEFEGPVLFIMGEADAVIPMEQSLKECHLPGISYIYVCTHSGHLGMLEEPEFCIDAVRYFLAGK